MSARGPDGDGLIILDDGTPVFAHRRLSIIDPTKRAAQPMGEATGRLHITFNGEITATFAATSPRAATPSKQRPTPR